MTADASIPTGSVGSFACLVVDDHPMLRSGLRRFLESRGAEIAEAASLREAVQHLQKRSFHLVLLDLSLPDADGLDGLERLLERWPRLRILVVSSHGEGDFALRCLRAGALGYVAKDASVEELAKAVEAVRGGRRYLGDLVAERLLDPAMAGGELHQKLSPREFEVFRMLGKGRSVGEIAMILSLSVKTVSTHRTRILEKTGLAGNMEIIRHCLRHGLVD